MLGGVERGGRAGTGLSGLTVERGGRAQASSPDATEATAPSPALPQRISLAILFFAYWCVDIVSPALPAIQESLALSATSAGLVFSVFFAGRLVTNLPAAWLVERVGPKWTAVAGSAALLLGSGLAAVAVSQATLLPARGIQGVGVALLATAGLLSVLRARPGGGAAMTAFNLSTGAGGSAGLLSGGYLTAEFGWRAVFWLSTVVSGVLLAGSLLARMRAAVPRTGRATAGRDERDSAPIAVWRGRGGGGESPGIRQLFHLGRLLATAGGGEVWLRCRPGGLDAPVRERRPSRQRGSHSAASFARPAAREHWLSASASVVPACCWCRSLRAHPGCSCRWRCTPLARLPGTARPVI